MQHACFAFFGSTRRVLYFLLLKKKCVWYDLWRRREIIGLGCWLCRPAISSAERFNCYIVNRASTSWKATFAPAQPGWSRWPPNRWIKTYLPCACVVFLAVCARVCVEDVVVLALARRPVPPSSGKTLFALADAPWMRVLKSSLPPPGSGETGTTSFRKKEKKRKVPGVSSAMELLCPPRVVQWGTEIWH